MKAIWKFPFKITDRVEIQMPDGAEFLHVAEQNGQACMWCKVDSDAPTKLRRFELRGTGHRLDGTEGDFLGTFLMHDGGFVFHLFDREISL